MPASKLTDAQKRLFFAAARDPEVRKKHNLSLATVKEMLGERHFKNSVLKKIGRATRT